jgi:hypothetical protein
MWLQPAFLAYFTSRATCCGHLVACLLRTHEVLGSNVRLETDYPDCCFSWSSAVRAGECQIVPKLGPDHILLCCFNFFNDHIIWKYVVWATGSIIMYLNNQPSSPFYIANSSYISHEFSKILYILKVHYHFYKSQPTVPVVRQLITVHALPAMSLRSSLILFSICLGLPSGLFPSVSPSKPYMHFCCSPYIHASINCR